MRKLEEWYHLLFGKRWQGVVVVCAAIIVVLLPFVFQERPTAVLVSEGSEYKLEIVATDAAREQGLSGRSSLTKDRGMLFVFEKPGMQCVWMKDMKFAIDILWLDSAKKVKQIETNVSPRTYPKKFCGDKSTKYVIELGAGEAKRAGVKVGDTLGL